MRSPTMAGVALLAALLLRAAVLAAGQNSGGREQQAFGGATEAPKSLLMPGEGWNLVSEGHRQLEGPATNAKGELFFNDVLESKTYRLDANSQVEPFVEESGKGEGQAFGPDGRLYAVAGGENKIVAYNPDGSMAVIGEVFKGKALIVRSDGKIYVTASATDGKDTGRVWLIKPDGSQSIVDQGPAFFGGVALSPDQSLLYVADAKSGWVYRYQIQSDGQLVRKQRFFALAVPDAGDGAGSGGMAVDGEGRLYAASRAGIQVFNAEGGVECILPPPNRETAQLAFGGVDGDILYACCRNKIFKRRLHARGVQTFGPPFSIRPGGS